MILPADSPLIDATWPTRLWMPLVLLGEYLQASAVPTELAFDYTYNAIAVASNLMRPSGWIGLAYVASLQAIVALRFRRGAKASNNARTLCAAAGGFALSYALFSNSVFLIVTLFAERLFLAPSFFLVVIIGSASVSLVAKVREPRALLVVKFGAAAFIAIQVLLSISRTGELKNDETLFVAQVPAQPDSVKGHLYFAKTLARQQRFEEAVWHLGVASAGRGKFPGPFSAPRNVPVGERLASLPELLAPGTPPSQFWPPFRAFAVNSLGAEVAPVIDQAALRSLERERRK